jgi:outer membrane protein assembly factor BamB
MTRHRRCALFVTIVTIALMLAGCSGSSTPQCSLGDPAMFASNASTSWPKFRHDLQNTGTENATVTLNTQIKWTFTAPPPTPGAEPLPFSASPVLSSDEQFIYIGSEDGRLYKIATLDGTEASRDDFDFTVFPQSIASTALVAQRDSLDAVFVGAGDGRLYGLTGMAVTQETNWPPLLGGAVTTSPALGSDGTVYVASAPVSSAVGLFSGVCPNGVSRFSTSIAGSSSSPAIAADGSIYFGADDHQLRAVQVDGTFKWAFLASAAILTSPVVEQGPIPTTTPAAVPTTTPTAIAIYVADLAGRIFKVDSNGRPISAFSFEPVGPIRSSPALAGDHLYVGSDDGNLYAVDKDTGALAWDPPLHTDAPIVSSPAVAMSVDGTVRVVVVGSNDGKVYLVQDNGSSFTAVTVADIPAADSPCAGAPLAPGTDSACAVRSSPAIGSDGTVYVGTDDGRVYAITSS